MDLSLLEIWQSMGMMARGVAILLISMGVGSVAVSFERFFVLYKALSRSEVFARSSRALIEAGELLPLLDVCVAKAYRKAPLAKMTRFAVEAFRSRGNAEEGSEFARRELERQLEVLAADARRGMGFLASVGSTAPFIGLFGTVIGIITAFQGIAASGGGGIDAVSGGIAEALIVTAVGLAVAIVSVFMFNYLNSRFDKLDLSMQHAAGELVDHLEVSDHGCSTR